MRIYNFHPISLEYINSGYADKDPLVNGNWLIPANATSEAPPNVEEGDRCVFRDGEWCVEKIPVPEPHESVAHTPTYYELRAREYPPMSDYLDGVVKGDQAQVQKYIDECQAVKAKYPKVV